LRRRDVARGSGLSVDGSAGRAVVVPERAGRACAEAARAFLHHRRGGGAIVRLDRFEELLRGAGRRRPRSADGRRRRFEIRGGDGRGGLGGGKSGDRRLEAADGRRRDGIGGHWRVGQHLRGIGGGRGG